MNKVIIVGRMAKDIELRQTSTGKAVGNFSVAADKRFKRQGEATADFFNVVVWGKQAELIDQYLKKGDRIALSGRLQTRTYDTNSGERKYITEIVLEEFDFLNSRSEAGQTQNPAVQSEQAQPTYQKPLKNAEFGLDLTDDFKMMVDDDDIPF